MTTSDDQKPKDTAEADSAAGVSCAAAPGYATKGPGPTEVMNLTDEYIATVGLLEDVQRLQKLARKWEHNCALYWLQQKEAAFIKHLRRLNHAIGTAWDAADSHTTDSQTKVQY